ncbi:hypothetical protein [Actinomadura rupiterrae]|uniref:hypothetical protein n=1 Tax=Actinomadura rupiterrae TaxID=559627 RepID=UPI0020A33896|nr:hypothetical protein [Actinomadura rupiterrae]MCP2343175.1 hypothetical protein [Actinomadura rupiterrae]
MISPGTYLLHDGRCRRCVVLADELETVFSGAVGLADLRDQEYRRLLDRVRPGWRFEPTLVTVRTANTRAVVGLRLRLRLIRVLGIRRSVQAARVARRHRVPAIGFGALGVRPHPAATPEEISAVGARTMVRLQPNVDVKLRLQKESVVVCILERDISLPGHVQSEVDFILQTKGATFAVKDIQGRLDMKGRIVLTQLLLRERVLVTVAS